MKNGPPSTRKRVVVRKLDKGLIKGFLDPKGYLASEIEVLDREGRLVHVPMSEIKAVFFVRDFEGNPDRAERKVFRSRPRLAGLWVRMTFKDNEVLEALLPNNLLEVDPLGYLVTPPDVYSNNLRFFIPRTALTEMEVIRRDIGWSGQAHVTARRPSAGNCHGRAPVWSVRSHQSPGKEIKVTTLTGKGTVVILRRLSARR